MQDSQHLNASKYLLIVCANSFYYNNTACMLQKKTKQYVDLVSSSRPCTTMSVHGTVKSVTVLCTWEHFCISTGSLIYVAQLDPVRPSSIHCFQPEFIKFCCHHHYTRPNQAIVIAAHIALLWSICQFPITVHQRPVYVKCHFRLYLSWYIIALCMGTFMVNHLTET